MLFEIPVMVTLVASLGVSAAATRDTVQPVQQEQPPPRFSWNQHPSFRFKNLSLDVRAKLQQDGHRSYEGAGVRAELDTYEFRRNRIGIEGVALRHIEFELERELRERDLTAAEAAAGMTQKSAWKDATVNLTYAKRAQLQLGRFKIPFGLDELTGIAQNDFVYRSLGADYLAPSRDAGVMLHGRLFNRTVGYWGGVFQHDGDNARSKKIVGGNRTFAARATAAPFKSAGAAVDDLELGTALTRSDLGNDSYRPNGLRGRTVMTEDTFFEPVYVNGRRMRWEADVDWPVGRASIRAEYTHVTDDRLGQGLANEDLPQARYRSWYAGGTYLLTADAKKRPIKPRRPFLQGGIGAVEVAARYERLWCDSIGGADVGFRNPRTETILPSGDRALTLGVTWILNRWISLRVNAIRERVEDAERSPVPNGSPFWSQAFRLQFTM